MSMSEKVGVTRDKKHRLTQLRIDIDDYKMIAMAFVGENATERQLLYPPHAVNLKVGLMIRRAVRQLANKYREQYGYPVRPLKELGRAKSQAEVAEEKRKKEKAREQYRRKKAAQAEAKPGAAFRARGRPQNVGKTSSRWKN